LLSPIDAFIFIFILFCFLFIFFLYLFLYFMQIFQWILFHPLVLMFFFPPDILWLHTEITFSGCHFVMLHFTSIQSMVCMVYPAIISIHESRMQPYSSTLMMETAGSIETLLPDYTSCPKRGQFFIIIIYLYFSSYLHTLYFLGLSFHENEGIVFLHNISNFNNKHGLISQKIPLCHFNPN
jgi:hypothetical protein